MAEVDRGPEEPNQYSFGKLLEREKQLRDTIMSFQGREDCKSAWDSFISTGKIGDYLKYKNEEADHCRRTFF